MQYTTTPCVWIVMEAERKQAAGEFFRKEYRRMVAFVKGLITDAADRDEGGHRAGRHVGPPRSRGHHRAGGKPRRLRLPLPAQPGHRHPAEKQEVASLDAAAENGASLSTWSATRYDAAGEFEKGEIREALFGAIVP